MPLGISIFMLCAAGLRYLFPSEKPSLYFVSAVEAAVNAVIRDKDITEQSEVDAMAAAIEAAVAGLEKRTESNPSSETSNNGNPGDTQPPQTGSNSLAGLWLALLLISSCALFGVTLRQKMRQLK